MTRTSTECPSCAAALHRRAQFCPRCGRALFAAVVPTPVPTPPALARSAVIAPAVIPSATPAGRAAAGPLARRSQRRPVLFPLASLVCAAVGIATLFPVARVIDPEAAGQLPLIAGPVAVVLGLLGLLASGATRFRAGKRLATAGLLAGLALSAVVAWAWSSTEETFRAWATDCNLNDTAGAVNALSPEATADAARASAQRLRLADVGPLNRFSTWPRSLSFREGRLCLDFNASAGTRFSWLRFPLSARYEEGRFRLVAAPPADDLCWRNQYPSPMRRFSRW